MNQRINNILFNPVSIAPLAMFRILFGGVMLFSTVRFWLKGFIETQYIEPTFFFKYYGFHWVQAPPENVVYLLFILMAIAALGIMLGSFYRVFISLFFLVFTYVELIDVSNYLNHYYFVSMISLLLIFLPAHKNYSLDAFWKLTKPQDKVPTYTLLTIKVMLASVYFYAGAAKLNYDWLILAQPLKTWLPANAHLPLIGQLLTYSWVAYAFSWFGALYDLTIPFLLWSKKTRPFAFVAVIAFHLLTWILFPIGVFPWVMMLSTLIFCSPQWHEKILRLLGVSKAVSSGSFSQKVFLPSVLALFIFFQLLFPWRYLLYPGNVFWHEQGYRFSWRVMLMEKAGYATFFVTDKQSGQTSEVNPEDYLTVNQVKQLSTQPDLILQFAHFIADEYRKKGFTEVKVTAQVFVSLNGQSSKLLIDPTQDLTQLEDTFAPKTWILPNA